MKRSRSKYETAQEIANRRFCIASIVVLGIFLVVVNCYLN